VRVRIYRRSAAIAAIVSAAVLSQAVAPAAVAADYPVVVSFPTPTVTVEYGQSWSIPVYTDFGFIQHIYYTGSEVVTATGVPSGFAPDYYFAAPYDGETGVIYAPYGVAPLGAGSYTFSVSGTYTDWADTYTAQTTAPATLKIEKAKLGIDLRVLADPSNVDEAIVTATFTGRFVDEYSSSFFDGAAISPAGTWQITIKDKSGEVAIESTVERAAGDDILATSFYWPDAEPGVNYTATATFTPSGASANNFSVTPATSFSYTGPETQRPQLTSTATSKPDPDLPESTGLGVPLWLLIVIVLLVLGLAALVTVLAIRLRRRPAQSTAEVTK
jgi:hypothetical protein